MRVRGGPVWEAMVAEACPREQRGRLMGLMGTIISLINVPAPFVGGYLYENVSPEMPFITSFLMNTLGTVLIAVFIKQRGRERS